MSFEAGEARGDLPPADYQRSILPHVSRTFALTIPQLPEPVADIVANAYLLCRIADTIEDDPGLSAAAKARSSDQFLAALRGETDAAAFGARMAARLAATVSDHERGLFAAVTLRLPQRSEPIDPAISAWEARALPDPAESLVGGRGPRPMRTR